MLLKRFKVCRCLSRDGRNQNLAEWCTVDNMMHADLACRGEFQTFSNHDPEDLDKTQPAIKLLMRNMKSLRAKSKSSN